MCGILGVIFRDPRKQADEKNLTNARDTLTHRGPDEAGLWVRPGVALAHRRLSILDLDHGQQPMVSDDQRFGLTYNGEVYNYRQLMRQYADRGETFQTTCDTELVLKALMRDGPAAVDSFHGMFAFGYYEQTGRKLLLVRDRLGQKPMYWHDTGDAFIFASELKAILAYTGRQYDIDPTALEQFYTRGYVLSPRTIFHGIHKLPAGHRLTLDANAWQINIEPWWDATPIPDDELCELSDEAVLDELDGLLNQSVAERLVSDVPIGTLLSGGIDSSLITAMASKSLQKQGEKGVKAFTIGFDESDAHNEMPYAEMVAKQYGCDWHPRNVRGDDGAWIQELDETAAYYDEPFGNFTVLAQRKLAQQCREELTVVLSGQGGDEISGGYPGRYNWLMQTDQAAADAQSTHQYAMPVDDVAQHLRKTSFLHWPGAQERMFSKGLKDAMIESASPTEGIAPFWNRHRWPDRLGKVLYTDCKTNLADYLICIEERATMSCSLEARNPMLDHRVVRFMLSLPGRYKVRSNSGGPMASNGIQNKWALHALAGRYLPREAFDRPKRGFTPPIQRWMAHNAGGIAEIFRETDGSTASLYSSDWRNYLVSGKYDAGATMPIYYCLMFALWIRRYGKYVQDLPGTAGQVSPQGTADSTWHDTYRAQTPEAMASARWFCQALRNFDPGETVRLVGDDAGVYRWLAEQSGLKVADEEASGMVCIGLDAMKALAGVDLIGGLTLLLFVPFAAAQQAELQAELQRIITLAPIQGHQAVPVGGDRGVLIARCMMGAPA